MVTWQSGILGPSRCLRSGTHCTGLRGGVCLGRMPACIQHTVYEANLTWLQCCMVRMQARKKSLVIKAVT